MSVSERDKITKDTEGLNALLDEDLKKDQELREEAEPKNKRRMIRCSGRHFRPIILSLFALLLLLPQLMLAQIEGSVSLGTRYSDNVFQLSDYDLQRFDEAHPDFAFVETSDDLSLLANVDLGYKFRYKWWNFTPSVSATMSQNVKNQDKSRRDALVRMRVDRYYWNFTALYGYYPYTYVREYRDTDGTGNMEQYTYARDLYRGDLNLRPFTNTSMRLHGSYEVYRYNEFFTEFDSEATTWGASIRHNFPYFGIEAGYYYKVLDNSGNIVDPLEDASYESNEYNGVLVMKKMLLDNDKPKGATWQPSLEIGYEQRYFQGTDDWYGGREDTIYNLRGTLSFDLSKALNLKLDYTHIYRNIDSPSASVRRLKEYGENRLGAALSYKF